MFPFYRSLTYFISPLLILWLQLRARRGKEDKTRLRERWGIASVARPQGRVLWAHAASVGEANSVLPLLQKLRATHSGLHILLTTGTVSSARLMQRHMPPGILHQYVPLDTPRACARFIRHWQPDAALWIESELWPNLLSAAHHSGCNMALINARMSERSMQGWQRMPRMIGRMLSCFQLILAQSEADAARLRSLGAKDVQTLGNLKHDVPPLAVKEEALAAFTRALQSRPHWLAASTHPGEEEIIADTHARLKKQFPTLLTIIVPRHPQRSGEIASMLQNRGLSVQQRTEKETPDAATDIYLANTFGELGLFYRACEVAFIGGSLVSHGGQNPLEAARLESAILFGPHMFNFEDTVHALLSVQGAVRVESTEALCQQVERLLADSVLRHAYAARARNWVQAQNGVLERVSDALSPLLHREAA